MSRALHIYRTYFGQHTARFGESTIAGQPGHLLFRD